MINNGSFNYEELEKLDRGLLTLINYIQRDSEFDHEEQEILSRPYLDLRHKIAMKMERIEDSHLKYEIKEFARMGW